MNDEWKEKLPRGKTATGPAPLPLKSEDDVDYERRGEERWGISVCSLKLVNNHY